MTEKPESQTGSPPQVERRVAERRYNRRPSAGEPSPPYFEAFDRIAAALERIEGLLSARGGEDTSPPARRAAGGAVG